MKLIDLSHRLQPRDYAIALLLDAHGTLTTEQLTAVLFRSASTCRHRLHALRRFGFVERFVRHRPDRPNAVCWVSSLLSARYAALAAGQPPPTARAVQHRQDRLYASPQLEHLLAVNQFFVDLLTHARHHPGTGLLRWWPESRSAAAFGNLIRPDGHGVWVDGDRGTGWFLELDRGTEPMATLVGKLAAYRRLAAAGGPPYQVLFVLPNRAREQHLHRRLADHPEPTLTVATTAPESGTDPAGPVWRLAGNGRHRLTLAELPAGHGVEGPLNPGPPTADQHPLAMLPNT